MQSRLCKLSRAELVGALLTPLVAAEDAAAHRAAGFGCSGSHPATDGDAGTEAVLAFKLGVARELLLRGLRDRLTGGPVIDSPQVLRDWLRLRCAGLEHEVFIVLYLDAQHRLIGDVEMFRGTLTQTAVYPREVVKDALAHNAAAVAFAHNHPSGSSTPSSADEFLTRNLRAALALVDVRVLDHFIVAADNVKSFAEAGLL
jgi:DNA repair protein RadC